ncbi:hypothetical protein [Ornithobacterium rhinotracheale]|uniref:hypothetical protein n=1 Tax=Ornithobacterium rhinotracheale TaxID=28251 RepID=UPI001FF2DDD8|nr:hypothetical protein [Ornithobacterium rhinotracheale]MCK0199114.1 hypothetical protein [Ornithobacterium rhinotracheale]
MGYEIKRIDNDDLADYAFQINGALALKNYTATVEGSRLRIAHTQNAALSILECEVSEVEIDGQVYDNAEDAQRALQAIVYADLPILVLTRDEKQKILDFDKTKANADASNVADNKAKWIKALAIEELLKAKQTEGTVIKFDSDRNYGTIKAPIETFTIDMEGAKIGTTALINFNGSSLPRDSKIDWRGSRDFFIAGANHVIYMTLLDNEKIHANLV